MKRSYYLLTVLVMVFCLVQTSCKDDDACDSLNATYDGDVKAIINSTCSYDGCHNSTNPSIPDYSTYSGLQPNLNADKFGLRVLDNKTMPPSTVPDGSPSELTSAQLELLQCWADDGYPQN